MSPFQTSRLGYRERSRNTTLKYIFFSKGQERLFQMKCIFQTQYLLYHLNSVLLVYFLLIVLDYKMPTGISHPKRRGSKLFTDYCFTANLKQQFLDTKCLLEFHSETGRGYKPFPSNYLRLQNQTISLLLFTSISTTLNLR